MSTQRAIVPLSAIFLLLLITDCSEGTKVLTRNWGPQSTLYLKGKHGKRNMLEMETDFPAFGPVYWMNSVSSIIGYQKSKPTLEQLFKKLKLYQYD
ncbi:hypothetical protein AB205_0173650 [Aquarana catesbeiana]|uniref:Spexin n=1 Tax=Aquarana catesbeiana TaxID=8400 RepID=A0A2G9RML2_AQUCT|nr:hypothetical protein AB205_0173650 [Aquarana catesbeiana]